MIYIHGLAEYFAFDNDNKIAYRFTQGDKNKCVSIPYSVLEQAKKDYKGANRFYKPVILLAYTDKFIGHDRVTDKDKIEYMDKLISEL